MLRIEHLTKAYGEEKAVDDLCSFPPCRRRGGACDSCSLCQ